MTETTTQTVAVALDGGPTLQATLYRLENGGSTVELSRGWPHGVPAAELDGESTPTFPGTPLSDPRAVLGKLED